jgi:hypothetical protein
MGALGGIIGTIFDFKEIIMLVVAGALFPAFAVLLMKILSMPYIRGAVGGVCFAGGKWFSWFLTRWWPKRGEDMEDVIQVFLLDVVLKNFNAGMDVDD